jgi:hypothetical protein
VKVGSVGAGRDACPQTLIPDVGGSFRTAELQPLSIEEQTGINIAGRDRAALRALMRATFLMRDP